METVDGTVIAAHGSLVRVQLEGRTVVVSSRRRLNWEGGTPQAPRLVAGDRVRVEIAGEGGVVVSVRARRSCLMRRAPGSRQAQVLAANIDQALLVFAALTPEPKRGLLDRFLVACALAGIEPLITINKRDQGLQAVEQWLPVYQALGYEVLRVSARTAWGLGEIKRRLAGRTSLFCGPSGAGKSSLLNAVYPGFRLKVGSVSEATGKGCHTTSRAELMPLPYGGFVVDTPGLKEFGILKPIQKELAQAFPELALRASGCRFADCIHLQEPGCSVRAALEAGEIDEGRYRSYASILADEELA
jgi:ribosome biogenesis GTPase